MSAAQPLLANRATLNCFRRCDSFYCEELFESFLKFGAEAAQLGDRTRLHCVLEIFAAPDVHQLGEHFYAVGSEARAILPLEPARRKLFAPFGATRQLAA